MRSSHPVWVRGLKLVEVNPVHLDLIVAPRVGAWIETTQPGSIASMSSLVAPRVGAWIETDICSTRLNAS